MRILSKSPPGFAIILGSGKCFGQRFIRWRGKWWWWAIMLEPYQLEWGNESKIEQLNQWLYDKKFHRHP